MTTQLAEGTVEYDGTTIHYAEAGSGPVVVLLHGGGPGASGVSNYSRNIDALAEHFRVIVPDMPGYGKSSKVINRDDPFGGLAEGVRGLLDRLGIAKASLVGNSYGGAAALRFALEHPQRVERMVLMGPGGVGTTRALPTSGLNCLLDYYSGNGPSREKLSKFIKDYLVYDASQVSDEIIDLRYQSSIDPDVVANPPLRRPSGLTAPLTLWRMDFTRDSRLKNLQTPTLVVWGAADKVNRPDGGRLLAETMPNCDLLLVSKTGHWVQWERAEFFNAVTRDFLAAVNL